MYRSRRSRSLNLGEIVSLIGDEADADQAIIEKHQKRHSREVDEVIRSISTVSKARMCLVRQQLAAHEFTSVPPPKEKPRPRDFRPRALQEQHRLERHQQHQQLTEPGTSKGKPRRVESTGLRPAYGGVER